MSWFYMLKFYYCQGNCTVIIFAFQNLLDLNPYCLLLIEIHNLVYLESLVYSLPLLIVNPLISFCLRYISYQKVNLKIHIHMHIYERYIWIYIWIHIWKISIPRFKKPNKLCADYISVRIVEPGHWCISSVLESY